MSEERKMSLREYKDLCKAKRGNKSVNDSLLSTIERASGGRNMSSSDFDQIQGKIKMSQVDKDH